MKFHGNADLLYNKLQNAELETNITVSPSNSLPTPQGVGHIAFVEDVLYICIGVNPDVWAPLTRELTAYTHNQSPASDTWSIQHDLNTIDITVAVYGADNQAFIPDSIETTGVNTAVVSFSSPVAGRAVVITGSIDGPVRKTPDGNIIVDWSNVNNKPSFATVATSGSFTDLLNTPTTTNLFVVSKNGNDTTGNGSLSKPFATIQKAHDIAESTVANTQGVTILIMPGTYTEALAITRPRTAFVGYSSFEWSTIIQTPVTITPSRRVQHPGNSPFSFDDIFFNVGTGQNALTFTGSSYSGALNLNRVRIYTTDGKGIVMNNTATDFDATVGTANNRIKWVDVDVQSNNGNKNSIEIQNAYGQIDGGYFYAGSAEAAVVGLAGVIIFSTCRFESSGAKVASVLTGGTVQARNSLFTNNQNDGNGVDVATSAYFVAVETTFAHATTVANSGFAIKGVAGSVVIYGYLSFMNTNPANPVINNRVSSAATRIPVTTTIAAV